MVMLGEEMRPALQKTKVNGGTGGGTELLIAIPYSCPRIYPMNLIHALEHTLSFVKNVILCGK